MESPPRLGLGTIYITPFMKWLIYYQSTCLKFRYGDEKMLGTQPHQTRGSTFTHCVLHFNPIKGTFNIVNLGCVRIELIFAETENWNWKHCSKIIFKCVNSTVGPIFNKKVAEKCNLWDREQCTDALFTVDKVNYCELNQKKKKKKREREKRSSKT